MSPLTVISCLRKLEHWSEDGINDLMASLQLLVEAQQAGQNIAESKSLVEYLQLLTNVECVGELDEATLKLLREEHQATAHRRKRKRGPEEEPLPRPIKRKRCV
jgi:hypothetical protein